MILYNPSNLLDIMVAQRGGTIERSLFDSGMTITVKLPGRKDISVTEYWGDTPAIEQAIIAINGDAS